MARSSLSARTRADHLNACALRHAREHLERLGYELLDSTADPAGERRLLACLADGRRELLFCRLIVACGLDQLADTTPAGQGEYWAALGWLAERPELGHQSLRFDRLTVVVDGRGALVGLEHLPDDL
jgi:hypothetical protein